MQSKATLLSVLVATLTSLATAQDCPADDGTNSVNNAGDTYSISCDTAFGGRIDGLNIEPNTFPACIDFCSTYTRSAGNLQCVGVE